jgi:hypothetical protein
MQATHTASALEFCVFFVADYVHQRFHVLGLLQFYLFFCCPTCSEGERRKKEVAQRPSELDNDSTARQQYGNMCIATVNATNIRLLC